MNTLNPGRDRQLTVLRTFAFTVLAAVLVNSFLLNYNHQAAISALLAAVMSCLFAAYLHRLAGPGGKPTTIALFVLSALFVVLAVLDLTTAS